MTFLFAATQKGVTKKEKLANVRLACAAPDLLAAAEAALTEARPRLGQDPNQPAAWQGGVRAIVSDETVDALVAAIAKAKEVK
jgi:hypothetical protein